VSKGTATLGGARPDVMALFNQSDFALSGWNFQMPAASLGNGSHTVTATAISPSGSALLVRSKTITIGSASGRMIGYPDAAGDAYELSDVTQGGTWYARVGPPTRPQGHPRTR
jgi:hypothetical protein